jgi:methylated-DNA-[protein]-cysteine S-methyltransferase
VIASLTAPWGPIHVAASSRGLVAVDQLVSTEAFMGRLARRFGAAPCDAGEASPDGAAVAHLRAGLDSLRAFLDGDLGSLDGLAVDLDNRPGWDRFVLGTVRGIPPGTTASYGQVARMIDRAGAARAVGGAVGRNPIGLVIPCHRVIAGDGGIGGYGGGWWGGREAGVELKRRLLAREGIHISAQART